MKKQPILVVTGPTASGKTALAVALSHKYGGEVISADSMQIYRGMDIATAKPTSEEMQGIPHHLLDFVARDRDFCVANYLKCARDKIAEIAKREKLPVVAGGTGLYISSLVDNILFSDETLPSDVRDRLTQEAKEIGNEAMLERLRCVDEETARIFHPNNIKRIIRALEVFETTGKKLSEYKDESRQEESPYNTCMIGLNYHDRQKLYDRINRRVDDMLERGLLEEAREVYAGNGLKTAHQAIGFKEFIPYFEGKALLTECVDKIKQETRRYAKRQLTWFRRDERIHWIYLDDNPSMENILHSCEIIIANQEFL